MGLLNINTNAKIDFRELTRYGGEGSGNFGHSGIPGHHGGSADGDNVTKDEKKELTEEERAKYKNYADVINSGDKKAIAELYKTDKEFRTMADILTMYTQGGFSQIRKAMTDVEEGRPIMFQWGETPAQQRNDLMQFHPTFVKNVIKGQDLNNMDTLEGLDAKQGLLALKRTIEQSNYTVNAVYRGVEWQDQIYKQILNPDGTPNYGVSWSHDNFFKPPKEGTTLTYKGTMSYTKDIDIAEKFVWRVGTAFNRSKESNADEGIIYKIIGAKGLNISIFSPWKQQEILMNGEFKVKKVTQSTRDSKYSKRPKTVKWWEIELEHKNEPINNIATFKNEYYNHNEYEDDDVRMIWPPEPWKESENKPNIVFEKK